MSEQPSHKTGPLLPVLILAGGIATRLRPLTETIPKALVELHGEPFIAHQLRLLRARGVDHVVVCAGYKGELIEEAVGDGSAFGLRVDYSFDGPKLLGTAGALKRALPLVADGFFVVYGDSYLPCDYRAVQTEFERQGRSALMTVFHNEGRWDTSNIEFAGGQIRSYDKRVQTPAMHHIDYGLGVFSARAFDHVPADQPWDLATLYQLMLEQGELAAYEVHERFYEIGSFVGLQETRRYLGTKMHVAPGSRRTVFLDRDGVLNRAIVRDGKPYPPATLDELEIIPGARAALVALAQAGWRLIAVTNQPDVARGTQRREVVEAINAAVLSALPVEDIFVCYHDSADHCDCRKPLPGLLHQAAEIYGCDLASSVLVGDRWRDVEAGQRAGCATVLIDYGYAERQSAAPPDCTAASLSDAAAWILSRGV